MKRIMQIIKTVLILSIFILIGCKKQRFLNFDNIIEVTLTEECGNCAIYIGKNEDGNLDIEIEDFELNFSDYYLFADNLSGPGRYDLQIEWNDYISFVDPTDKLRFILVNEGGNPSEPDYSDGGRKMIMQSVKKLKPRGWYFWEIDDTFGEGTRFFEYDKKVPKPEGSNSSADNELGGKWYQVDACTNSSGDKNYFNFSTSSSGEIGQIDCNNSCGDAGTFTQFNYTISGSSVSITPTSVSDFCGVTPTLASPFTVQFSVSGNILTLDGQIFEK